MSTAASIRRPSSPIRGASGRGEDSKAFAERLRATGTKVTLFDGSAYTHMSINRDFGEDGDALTAAALTFLKSTVG